MAVTRIGFGGPAVAYADFQPKSGTSFDPVGNVVRIVGLDVFQSVAGGLDVFASVAAGLDTFVTIPAGLDVFVRLQGGIDDVR